ncbi:MAG TPA: peptidylprolyl isomerase [Anaerolineales bacterium]
MTGAGSTPQITRAATLAARPLPTLGLTPSPSSTLRPVLSLEPGDHLVGDAEAPVILLAYLDFQCRYCAGVAQALRQLQTAHALDASLVYRPFVQADLHDKSTLAAIVAEAAGRQGAFWEMFDVLYASQDEWIDLTAEAFLDWSAARAEALGLERSRFSADLEDPAIEETIEAAATRARRAGVPGAPVLYLNGAVFQPPPTPVNLEASVRLELLVQRQYASYPELVIDPAASYHAWLRFDGFEMRVELYPEAAPVAVNNFVFLSREGWYDGSPVHRVLPGVLFETGDPSGTGLGGPGYNFPTEASAGLRFDRPGRVAMSSVGPGTNGSQFFITLSPQPALDGSRTIFGQVVEGLEAASDWQIREPLLDLLEPPPAVLEGIEVVEG